ncbi:MAG TPA: M48 family metalloprotease [Bacteroidota bacterium]|nr:M48 family metalloprotease [Bacteroidota bacterium]
MTIPSPFARRNIYEQQAHNRQMTVFVMIGFALFLGLLGMGFDFYFSGSVGEGGFIPLGTVVALAVGTGSAFWSLSNGPSAVLTSAGAVPADDSNPSHRQLLNVVDEMAIASGLPRPAVYVIPDADPNAFATGKDPQHSSIAVTQGLLDSLNREELQGVVAHEMSHIRNYDIRLMTVVAALMGAILLLSDWARRSLWYGRGRKRNSKSSGQLGALLLVLWLIGIILAPIITRMMAMAVSRKREYLADASGAEMTRNPLGLASALKKIDTAVEPTASIKRGAAHLCIADPLGRSVNSREGFVAELFGTHPPIEKRITALQAMAYQSAPTPAA